MVGGLFSYSPRDTLDSFGVVCPGGCFDICRELGLYGNRPRERWVAGWEKDPVGEFKLTKLGGLVIMQHLVSGTTLGYFTGNPDGLVPERPFTVEMKV